MRQRLSSILGFTVLLTTLNAPGALAQLEVTNDGALFLLLPIGAQTVGMGQAMVAERPGSEAVWSNPAGIAREEKKEAALHHSETIAARGDVLTLLFPAKRIGAFALSLNVLNFGNQEITDATGNPIGLVLPRNILVAGTYGAAIGQRLNLGVTFKRLQYREDCSGQCAPVATFSASSNAIDLGVQYDVPGPTPIRLGAAVRNIGSKLQVNERDEAAPLPTRVEVGFSYQLAFLERYVSDVAARLAGDLIAAKNADDPSLRVGVDLVYQKNVHLRAGYIANDANGANAAVGFGLGAGRLMFDIARTFGGLSEDAGKTPTYVSLRFLF